MHYLFCFITVWQSPNKLTLFTSFNYSIAWCFVNLKITTWIWTFMMSVYLKQKFSFLCLFELSENYNRNKNYLPSNNWNIIEFLSLSKFSFHFLPFWKIKVCKINPLNPLSPVKRTALDCGTVFCTNFSMTDVILLSYQMSKLFVFTRCPFSFCFSGCANFALSLIHQ